MAQDPAAGERRCIARGNLHAAGDREVLESAVSARDIIVVGASLGGVEALPLVIGSLPPGLSAAILVVLHMHPSSPGRLAALLRRTSRMPVANAVDGETIRSGQVYVAVPNQHLMIEDRRIRLSRGPRESHARPAIDVLFRSAAQEFGERVIGVLLTGTLDDGTAGLWAIKDRGGIAVVQAPDEAPYASMPRNALRHVRVDHVLKISEMAPVLERLTSETLITREAAPMNGKMKAEIDVALGRTRSEADFKSLGSPSLFTCPECHGSMIEIAEGTNRRYRCHTGHAFGEATLSGQQAESIEFTLAKALALLEERDFLLSDAAARLRTEGLEAESDRQLAKVEEIKGVSRRLRHLMEDACVREE